MSFLRTHCLWICILAIAATIFFGSGPVLDYAQERAAQNLADIKTAQAKASQDLQQLRTDAAAARRLKSQIDRAHAEEVLAPVDRLKAAAMMESEALTNNISHFTYTLAPEEHVSFTAGGEPQELAKSLITLSGDTRDDRRLFNFAERCLVKLRGRARILEMNIARTNLAGPLHTDANLHFSVIMEWISNGALQTVAGGP